MKPSRLTWADTYHEWTGAWPTRNTGVIPDVTGSRGLKQADGGSLARLLARQRDVRNHMALPSLKPADILAWADSHFERTGGWPIQTSGSIPEAPGETW